MVQKVKDQESPDLAEAFRSEVRWFVDVECAVIIPREKGVWKSKRLRK
jgi:hypothetical protein